MLTLFLAKHSLNGHQTSIVAIVQVVMYVWLEVYDWRWYNLLSYKQVWRGGLRSYQNPSYYPLSARSLLSRHILGVAARLPGTLRRELRD